MTGLTLTWLGQSGFVLRSPETNVACDLYLSDYCRKKSRLDHTRLMPIPVKPEELDIDIYLITHTHIDHFDPETVGPLLRSRPSTRFFCPPSGRKVIDEYFPSESARFELLQSGREYRLTPELRLYALPAAHEELEKDAEGEYIAFSYLVLDDVRRQAVFFAGDTIPFAGQGTMIRQQVPEGYRLTLVLPVNGRDAERAKLGFKGNLTLTEAVALYRESGGDRLVPCHFGMFALNDLKTPLSAEYFAGQGCNGEIPQVMKPFEL